MSRFSDYPERLRLEVLSLGTDGFVHEDIKSLTVPLEDGSLLGILPKHAPLIAATSDGTLRFTDQEGKHERSIKAGIMTIRNNIVSILTTY